jgi:hypothetical protein
VSYILGSVLWKWAIYNSFPSLLHIGKMSKKEKKKKKNNKSLMSVL